MSNVLLIQSDSNRHLGLFNDLNSSTRVDVITFPNHASIGRKVLTRVSPDVTYALALREQGSGRQYDRAVVVDTALSRMTRRSVDHLRSHASEICVLLLNSLDASSPSFASAKDKLSWFSRSEIYTFDPVDAKRLGCNFFGLSYYSQHFVPHFASVRDCYFVGGIKGGRGSLVYDLCCRLRAAGVDALFECARLKQKIDAAEYPGISWLGSGWQPYERVLKRCAESNCIIEVLQDGQHAQSVRYFEAVCMNKRLLTTNEAVVDLPYYDSRYMKVFHDPMEVDIDWLKNGDMPDYGYDGRFSPRNNRLFQFE